MGNGRVNGTGSALVLADYLLPSSGRFTFTTSHSATPPSEPATVDHTVVFDITASRITGTATYRSTNGPSEGSPDMRVCEGSATFDLERTK